MAISNFDLRFPIYTILELSAMQQDFVLSKDLITTLLLSSYSLFWNPAHLHYCWRSERVLQIFSLVQLFEKELLVNLASINSVIVFCALKTILRHKVTT